MIIQISCPIIVILESDLHQVFLSLSMIWNWEITNTNKYNSCIKPAISNTMPSVFKKL